MSFKFGARSELELATVKPDMVKLCHRALYLTPLDFGIRQGRRSEEEQRDNVAKGVSQTMDSKHMADPADGLASAIDFLPYWKGQAQQEWPFIYPVANAFMQASKDLDIPAGWGGSWGMDLWAFRDVIQAQEAYILLRAKRKGKAFFDGYHIELADNFTRPLEI